MREIIYDGSKDSQMVNDFKLKVGDVLMINSESASEGFYNSNAGKSLKRDDVDTILYEVKIREYGAVYFQYTLSFEGNKLTNGQFENYVISEDEKQEDIDYYNDIFEEDSEEYYFLRYFIKSGAILKK